MHWWGSAGRAQGVLLGVGVPGSVWRRWVAWVWTEQAAAASREVRARSRNGGRNIDSELELEGVESG